MLYKKMPTTPRNKSIEDRQALALHQVISALMREFRLEPGLLAGSVYADLHANDIALFEVLSGPGEWNVRSVAQAISVPITTVSSALDRLERKGLIARFRIPEDRRIVRLSLTAHGRRLAVSLEKTHIDNCRAMLARLGAKDREQFPILISDPIAPVLSLTGSPLWTCVNKAPNISIARPASAGMTVHGISTPIAPRTSAMIMNFRNVTE